MNNATSTKISDSLVYMYNELTEYLENGDSLYTRRCSIMKAMPNVTREDILEDIKKSRNDDYLTTVGTLVQLNIAPEAKDPEMTMVHLSMSGLVKIQDGINERPSPTNNPDFVYNNEVFADEMLRARDK